MAMPTARGLPELGDAECVVRESREGARGPAAELAQAIFANGDRLQRRRFDLWAV